MPDSAPAEVPETETACPKCGARQSADAKICAACGIAFDEAMLSWPAGPKPFDGVWAPHWYAAVWRSTGFEPWRERHPRLDAAASAVAESCRPAYERLRALRLGA